MNLRWKILTSCAAVGLFLIAGAILSDPLKNEARITKIIREVNILPSDAPPRSAAENDQVNENTAVRTGDESRTELTFDDLTVTRLGANTLFSFNKAGRSGELGSGSILVYVPKNSGGGEFKTKAVTVGITGTTLIFESTQLGDGRVIVLEGGVQLGLINQPREIRNMRAGQMLELKAGATKLPAPVDVDLDQIMKTHPLITDFSPLPSQELIVAVIRGQQSSTSGRPPPRPRGTPFIPRTPTSPPRGPGILIPAPPPQPTFAPPAPPYTLSPRPHSCWCCIDGQVFESTAADCRQRDGQCYGSRKEALRNCKSVAKVCWCCINEQIVRTTVADCREREGQCYGSKKEATRNCRGGMQPPPPPRGPGTPTRTPTRKETPNPSPGTTRPTVGKGQWPRPIKPPKKGAPKPTPSPRIF